MDRGRFAGGLGIAGAATTFLLAVAPYAVLDLTAVGPYVSAGPGALPVLAVFPLLAIVALAAGLAGRQDPASMAGAAVVLGAFTAAIAWWWAFSVTPSLVGSLTDVASFEYHRWSVALAATALFVTSAAYARAVL